MHDEIELNSTWALTLRTQGIANRYRASDGNVLTVQAGGDRLHVAGSDAGGWTLTSGTATRTAATLPDLIGQLQRVGDPLVAAPGFAAERVVVTTGLDVGFASDLLWWLPEDCPVVINGIRCPYWEGGAPAPEGYREVLDVLHWSVPPNCGAVTIYHVGSRLIHDDPEGEHRTVEHWDGGPMSGDWSEYADQSGGFMTATSDGLLIAVPEIEPVFGRVEAIDLAQDDPGEDYVSAEALEEFPWLTAAGLPRRIELGRVTVEVGDYFGVWDLLCRPAVGGPWSVFLRPTDAPEKGQDPWPLLGTAPDPPSARNLIDRELRNDPWHVVPTADRWDGR